MTIQQLGTTLALVLFCAATVQAGEDICGDVNESSSVTPADALLVLKKSVGQTIDLSCPSIKGLAVCEEDLSDANEDLDVCLGDSCGDGVVNAVGEQCDGLDLNDTDCASLSYGLGDLACTDQCKFDATGCRVCTGLGFEGACWFFGSTGQSCSEVCAAAGQVYDDATRTVAGSAGTDEFCEFLLEELGAPGTGLDYPSFDCEDGLGCLAEDGERGRCATPVTTSSQAFEDAARVCACTSECSGAAYDGACWFLGSHGQSCDEVCAGVGKSYDDATQFVAGSQGSDQACEGVLDALEAPGTGLQFPNTACDQGTGCGIEGEIRGRCGKPVTTSSAAYEEGARVCACQ